MARWSKGNVAEGIVQEIWPYGTFLCIFCVSLQLVHQATGKHRNDHILACSWKMKINVVKRKYCKEYTEMQYHSKSKSLNFS